jgi:hypothetical protein
MGQNEDCPEHIAMAASTPLMGLIELANDIFVNEITDP